MTKGGSVYIMTNKLRTTLYIGVTSDLYHRILQHKDHTFKNSFTDKYNLEYCIYYENFFSIEEAILREKQIKKWRREKKEMLINSVNPHWTDLWGEIQYW
jgi:putative endonuclease